MNAVLMGIGSISLCTAALAARNGVEVLGVDFSQSVVDIINEGKIHINEPNLPCLVNEVVEDGKLSASVNATEANCYIIAAPTPLKQNRSIDLSFVEAATKTVIPYLKAGALFVLESTCPVGTTEKMADLIFAIRPELKDRIFVAYAAPRVLHGNILHELTYNDRVIGGINRESTLKAIEFYRIFTKGELHQSSVRTAEMCKLTENCNTDAQIAFANELSIICDKMDVNVWELINLANKHPRVNILQPGCGVGGKAMTVDPWQLVSACPEQACLIRQARQTNEYKPDWCANKILESCAQFEWFYKKAPVVACMGLSFKPNMGDLTQSPANYIVERVISESKAEVLVVEPNILTHASYNLSTLQSAYAKADIVIWLVNHAIFSEVKIDLSKLEMDFCGTRS